MLLDLQKPFLLHALVFVNGEHFTEENPEFWWNLSAVGSFFFFVLVLPARPEKLEVAQGMQLEQVKRKIPSVLFSWDTYSASREGRSGAALSGQCCGLIPCSNPAFVFNAVMKCGMSCSLFEVVDGKGKPTSGSLAALVNKLERDRMVSERESDSESSCTPMDRQSPRWSLTHVGLANTGFSFSFLFFLYFKSCLHMFVSDPALSVKYVLTSQLPLIVNFHF